MKHQKIWVTSPIYNNIGGANPIRSLSQILPAAQVSRVEREPLGLPHHFRVEYISFKMLATSPTAEGDQVARGCFLPHETPIVRLSLGIRVRRLGHRHFCRRHRFGWSRIFSDSHCHHFIWEALFTFSSHFPHLPFWAHSEREYYL